jgi:hypothetical protein
MNMTFKFEKSLYSQPRMIAGISITKSGRIGLPKFFLVSHAIQRGVRAYLYWDAQSNVFVMDLRKPYTERNWAA